MNFNWEIENNFIFGFDNNLLNKKDINKIYFFDLDNTLIKTKSGKKFPVDKHDWVILFDNISNKMLKLTNCIIGIISNQKGLKNKKLIDDWIDKIKDINKEIKFDFVFASTENDGFRKPMSRSYEFIKNKFININWDKIILMKKIYYIGDAFGRKNDFSDTDIKFALNCKFKFKTPEIFFSCNISKKNNEIYGSITYPVINYLSKKEQSQLFNSLNNYIKKNNKVLIILIGFPASGKSFLRKELIKTFSNLVYTNNDDVIKKNNSKLLIKKISTDYDYIIDDNTNLNKVDRMNKLDKFKSYFKIGVFFDYELEVYFHLNWMRMYWFGEKLLAKVTYYTLNKYFDKKNIESGFDAFFNINKIFLEFNFDDKIKYYF